MDSFADLHGCPTKVTSQVDKSGSRSSRRRCIHEQPLHGLKTVLNLPCHASLPLRPPPRYHPDFRVPSDSLTRLHPGSQRISGLHQATALPSLRQKDASSTRDKDPSSSVLFNRKAIRPHKGHLLLQYLQRPICALRSAIILFELIAQDLSIDLLSFLSWPNVNKSVNPRKLWRSSGFPAVTESLYSKGRGGMLQRAIMDFLTATTARPDSFPSFTSTLHFMTWNATFLSPFSQAIKTSILKQFFGDE